MSAVPLLSPIDGRCRRILSGSGPHFLPIRLAEKNIFSGYLHFSKFSLDCLPSLAREQPDVPILDTHLNSERLIELPLRLFEANNRAVENRKVRSYLFGQKAV